MMGIEWYKIRRNKLQLIIIILIPLAINALLTFDLHFRYEYLLLHKAETGLTYWQLMFKEQNIFMINELLSIFCTLFVYLMFSVETKYGGWINVKLSKKSMFSVLIEKYVIIILFMILQVALNCLSMIPVGKITGVGVPIEWGLLITVFGAQLVTIIGVTAINFLIVAIVPKIVYLIPISCFFFLISVSFQGSVESVINKINPYSFASLCYTQGGADIGKHAVVSIVLAIICIVISARMLERKDELI